MNAASSCIFKAFLFFLAAGTFTLNLNASPVIPADNRIETIIEIVREKHAPDPLTSLFDISFEEKNDRLLITGVADSIEAVAELKGAIFNAHLVSDDRIKVVPNKDDLSEKIWAAVTDPNAVTDDGRERPPIGTPLMRLISDGNYSLVKLPSGRIARIAESSIRPMTETDIFIWNRREKIIVTSENTEFHPLNMSEKPLLFRAGTILRLDKESPENFTVATPDGKRGLISKVCAEKLSHFQETNELRRRERRSAFLKSMNQKALTLHREIHNSTNFIGSLFASHDLIILADPDHLSRSFPHVHVGSGSLKAGDILLFEKRSGEKTMAWSLGGGRFVTPALRKTALIGSKEASAIGRLKAAVRPDYGFLNDPCLTSTRSNPFYQTPAQPLVPCRKRAEIEKIR